MRTEDEREREPTTSRDARRRDAEEKSDRVRKHVKGGFL